MKETATDILEPSNGARFYRCAFQVNPNDYASYRGQAVDPDAKSYAERLLNEAKENEIEVLAITHHNNCDFVEVIRPLARDMGMVIFPGFELKSSEGVHMLCLYGPEINHAEMERYLGEFGIRNTSTSSNSSKEPFKEILRLVQDEQGGIVVAAHVTNDGGLLKVLSGEACIHAWRDERLLAIQIPGKIDELPRNNQNIRRIIRNKEPMYRRNIARGTDQAMAVVNAKDVVKPEDLAHESAWSWIKMAEPSIEGLRQAFLDPDSRIRLSSEEPPSPHICIEAMEWEGGFLDGVHVRLNENLNVLIGGRGAGKSTVVESIRHAFGMTPTTEEAARSHHSMVKDVIGQNTTIRVLVSSPRPAPRKYRIVRDGANPPEVYDVDGKPLSVEPGFVVGNIQVYGQHELSELSRREDKQRRLLERFATDSEAMQKKKRELQRKLKESREGIRRLREEMNRLEEQLVEQPKVEETLRRYETLGIEEKLKARSALVKEERILKTARERLEPLEELLAVLRDASPDLAFLSDAALADLAGKEILTRLRQPLALVHETLAKMHKELGSLKARALDDVGFVETTWQTEREQPVLQEYQSILKKLDRESVNGDEFIELQKQLEEMKPRKDQYGQMQRNLAALRDDRTSLLVEWEEVKMQDRRGWSGVGKRVSKKLAGNVRVVMGKEDRSTLEELFREHVDGKFSKSLQHLLEEEALNAKDLADGIHKGADALRSAYACLTPQAAERLADAGENLAMRIEEEDWPQLPEISLNLGTEENTHFVPLPRLSTGQKATALLCLLLLESDAPLVIDQPEDDLDNRFISEYIVPRMKQEKQRRQFLFASHNANIPVLGDADLIIGLTTESDKASGKISGVIKPGHMGAIDNQPVRGLIEEILEGGRNAFSTRRAKYGF